MKGVETDIAEIDRHHVRTRTDLESTECGTEPISEAVLLQSGANYCILSLSFVQPSQPVKVLKVALYIVVASCSLSTDFVHI